MDIVKLVIKIVISFFAFMFVFFSFIELDIEELLEDLYELITFIIFSIGSIAGTIIMWYREKMGSALLVITIVIEFIIFMIVDGELIENLSFLTIALLPLLVLWISSYQDNN